MSFDIARLSENVDLSGGEWIDGVENIPGLRLKVRSINYKPYQVASTGFYRKNRKLSESDEGLLATQPGSGKVIAEKLLVDWDMSKAVGPYALQSGGRPVEYSSEMATAILSADDPHGIGGEYRNAVLYAAGKVAEKLLAKSEDAAGN